MVVKKPQIKEPGIYYITFTNYKWLPLIQLSDGWNFVYKWFDHLKENGHYITGYVIMPNHLHVLIAFGHTKSINTIVGNAKRFMAYGIVKKLKEQGQKEILDQLASGVSAEEKNKGKLHEVFEPSFDIKDCYGRNFINQKLDYIHNNPIVKKWSLAEDTISYQHSSARFYETGIQGAYPVTNFMDLIDKDWTD